MNIAIVMIGSLAVLVLAFRFYGRFVSRTLQVDPSLPTPAVRINDGVDYVPTKPLVLFAHHFANFVVLRLAYLILLNFVAHNE